MRVLMIASCFAPKNVIGAVRLSKIAKYLIRDGHEVCIISPQIEAYDTLDTTLECEEFNHAKRITVQYSTLTRVFTKAHKLDSRRSDSSEIGNQVNNSFQSRIYKSLRHAFTSWRSYEWSKKVNALIRRDHSTFDLVFSSYPNVSTHDSAWYAVKHKKARTWIADFRDPIALDSIHGKEKHKLDKFQSDIVHRANITTHVSRIGVEKFVCFPEDKKKVVWIPNGFDEEDFQHLGVEHIESDNEHLVFSYAGGLYSGERDCSPLFQAIRELIDDGSILEDEVIFEYAGRDYGILKNQASKYHVDHTIHDKGLISRAESIEMQASSDCVVVATFCYTDDGGAMTGKIYEPVMMRRPILLLVNGPGKNSEPGAFVDYLNAGTVYEESAFHGDVTVINDMIMNMIAEKKTNGTVLSHLDNEKREEYNYKSIVAKLSEQIKNMAGEIN